MTTDIVFYKSITEFKFIDQGKTHLNGSANGMEKSKSELPEVLFITSFPPRECGIATYSQDLIRALTAQFGNSFKSSICALETDNEHHTYTSHPKYKLNTDCHNSFVKMAFYINRDKHIKLVVLQHEFGFYAKKLEEFKQFFDSITKPIVFVFHTVLPSPDEALKDQVQDMAAVAASIIVMTDHAATILINEYKIPSYLITIIPHGTHLVPPLDRKKLKKHYDLTHRKVLSTFGLLGRSKSIETTLEALPAVIAKYPEVLFLVLGKTHPGAVYHEGEQYRQMLEDKVKELKLENHVRFVNEYLELHVLLEYLQLTDIYLFTSNDRNQAVSGTFSYAVSCGCPVISTPIPHAKEVLSNNNGIIFDFENVDQLSTAILFLLDDEQLRAQISLNSFHKMASTAWQNSAISHALLFAELAPNDIRLSYDIPPVNISHVKKMTTDFAMLQFSKIANPDVHSGYTLDDNARALIAICQHYEMFKNEHDLSLIDRYISYIKYCIQPNGRFLNYVNEQKEFTAQNDPENLEDSNGRAIWALGYVSSLTGILPLNLTNEADNLLRIVLTHVDKIHSTRAMAFIIKGIHYQHHDTHLDLLEILADRLVQMYKHERTDEWYWFENYLTYGNSLLPEAMLCAYLSTKNEAYLRIAKESFGFLLSKIIVDGSIKVISNKGWHVKDRIETAKVGGEQPIDVAYTILALEKFYNTFRKEEYKQKAMSAFNWFLGDNHLHQIVYNPRTGGCYDGVEEYNVNLNQGAESTLSYLMARLAIARLNETIPEQFLWSQHSLLEVLEA